VRKLVTWLLVSLGIAALVRRLRRRDEAASWQAEPPSAEPAPAEAAAGDPADELRRRLAESRSADEPAEAPAETEATPEERRAEVHEQGRTTIDEMRFSDEE
jgi:hypothetical protein